MASIIDNLIKKKYFDLNSLNSRLTYFVYSNMETPVPPINGFQLNNQCLIMSASEMLSLVRNFCFFFVGDLVDEDDDMWQYYLLLLEITEILTSQTFTAELLEYLKHLITEHHERFIKISKIGLKPKFHFLLHYVSIIEKIGPPILVS